MHVRTAERRRTAILVVLASAILASVTSTVAADETLVEDPKEVLSSRYPHALDIRSASMEHEGDTVTHSITLYRGFGEENGLKGGFHLGVAFDTDGDPSDLERALFIVSYEGHLVGQMVKGDGRRAGPFFRVEHPTARTAVATFSTRLLGRPDSYRWFAVANSPFDDRCCFDTAPNRRWVAHDIAAPVITEPTIPVSSSGSMRQTIALPIDFGVRDVGGSGLAGWTVRARELGSTTWETVATGTGEGAQTANLARDGQTYQVCIQAVDRSGNVADGEYHIASFAFDDAGGGITYSGSWQTSAPADSYGSTVHASSEVGASASVTYSNPSVAHLILPPGFDGAARISLNGVEKGSIPASIATMPREIRAFGVDIADYDSVSPPYTLTFTVESGTSPLDGILLLRSAGPPPLGPPPPCG